MKPPPRGKEPGKTCTEEESSQGSGRSNKQQRLRQENKRHKAFPTAEDDRWKTRGCTKARAHKRWHAA
ncbi:hypothetical protein NDU88_003511 [Pleurodeles waltl]|uniref:Uncharacterized protein n=1 Tax=Pleurodeles waltl TaxID=8319 RepID=A0AAV7T5T0_PLEWA|nr:hypothetical protein NDU88_003511 [Pleurodeles waltl]